MNKLTENKTKTSKTVIAKADDGTVQITFTIPFEKIQKARTHVAEEVGKTLEIPGFRKGLAPIEKVIKAIPENTLLEKTLSKILPDLLTEVINEHKIRPAVYPRFQLVKAKEDEDWEVRAVTCEVPDINLGNYKEIIKGRAKTAGIWTPDAGSFKEERPRPREEKEQEIIKTLLESVNVKIPKVLIDEETNSRLSRLLERIEKLGLSLESYLASIGKTSNILRSDYEKEAQEVLTLDLILNKVAEEEKLEVTTKEIDEAISVSSADKTLAKDLESEEKKRILAIILRKRKALNFLVSLI